MLTWQIFYRPSYLLSSLYSYIVFRASYLCWDQEVGQSQNKHVVACEIYTTPKTTQLMFLNTLKSPEYLRQFNCDEHVSSADSSEDLAKVPGDEGPSPA